MTALLSAECSCRKLSSAQRGSSFVADHVGICLIMQFCVEISNMLPLSCLKLVQHGPQLAMEVKARWSSLKLSKLWILMEADHPVSSPLF